MKTVKLVLMTSIMLLLFASCEKNQEGDWATYYKTIGEGYIFNGMDNTPIKGATVTVVSLIVKDFPMIESTYEETFTTDENGYYQVRFIRRVHNKKVTCYRFRVDAGLTIPSSWEYPTLTNKFPHIEELFPEDIKEKKTIMFDTVKYYAGTVRW